MFRKPSRVDSVRGNKRVEFSYDRMEPRQFLTVTSSFDAGTLSIELSEQMDRANIEVIDDVVRVDGQIVDGDPLAVGFQLSSRLNT